MPFLRYIPLMCILCGLFFFQVGCTDAPTDHTEILWDEWGVPHITAASSEQLMYAFGWAQMQNHANRVLRLYGMARGRAAEYWGEEYLQSDQYIHTMGVPDRSQSWFDQQSPKMQRFTEAFVAGMNAYIDDHPEAIQSSYRQVLPVQVTDPIAYMQRLVHFTFLPGVSRTTPVIQRWPQTGSNGWALAPSKTTSGQSMLLINPHLQWSGQFTWFEAQLTSPEYNMYGATFLGLPVIVVGFNRSLGWTATNNTIDVVDLYQLQLTGDRYRWNGSTRAFKMDTARIRIRQSADSLSSQAFTVQRSIHGPVIDKQGNNALAIRIAGLDQSHIFEQLWDMGRASTLSAFQSAISRLQIPMFNLLYADREGHILYFFGGRVPDRPMGNWDYWQDILPGDTSGTLWTRTHPYEDLPKVIDPPSGWVQNTNDPPWNATFPRQLSPDAFPAYMAPVEEGPPYRPQRSIQMLQSDSTISFTELQEYKHSTRMVAADRLLDDLLPLLSKQDDPVLLEAGKVLTTWDRQANTDSRGAVLFV